jgi:hypothetical protein
VTRSASPRRGTILAPSWGGALVALIGPALFAGCRAPATVSPAVVTSEPSSTTSTASDDVSLEPLKARAAEAYRMHLIVWFSARFHIRGKVPYERLKLLNARAVVSFDADRRVTGFTIGSTSGEPMFDETVEATLSQMQADAAQLPEPPPMWPDLLRSPLPVSFACTVRKFCE